MADERDDENLPGDDDVYVIDDTGESLSEAAAELGVELAPGQETVRGEDEEVSGEETRLVVKEAYLRSRADFENFRKRSEREKSEFFKYALAGTVKDLLPVLDNFERALATSDSGEEFRRGVELIYKQLAEVLQKQGLKMIDQAGVPFDPAIHEAISREEGGEPNTVVEVLQKGYFLNDRLLRPALVRVSV